MAFSTTLWEWYAQDEHKRVLSVCEAIEGLTVLASSADVQRNTIPDCPACEVWSASMLPVNEVLTVCGSAMPHDVRAQLQQVWALCDSLPEAAFLCHDQEIFYRIEWQAIRHAAAQALELIEVVKLTPYLDELMSYCSDAVRGLKGRDRGTPFEY
ncbi:hypothetical protein [Pseudomonas allokribbensis]|uniref:hypothetical protein n=1 Tax=Pseudomonas allokribbensis TaxID=2774460 RepID=UPI0017885C6A|nr:hypothetical protein [Pseudomonas allokribbensis]